MRLFAKGYRFSKTFQDRNLYEDDASRPDWGYKEGVSIGKHNANIATGIMLIASGLLTIGTQLYQSKKNKYYTDNLIDIVAIENSRKENPIDIEWEKTDKGR